MELVLDIKDDSLLPILKKVIKAFPGISIKIPKKQKKADPTLMTKEEFFKKVDESKKEWEEGHYKTIHGHEQLAEWLNSL